MLAAQRRQAIRRLLAERPAARVVELAAELRVSRETVRRDLLALARAGDQRHSAGRARARDDRDPCAAAKVVVAEAAARLVRPGQTVALTAGSTTRALARALAQIPGVVIVTNSLPAARLLGGLAPGMQLVLTGGVPGIVGALLGPIAVNTVRSLNVDWLFMGANGLDSRTGVTAFDLGEAELHREWIHHAGNVAVLVDHSKWGVRALSTVLPLSDVGVLVTDDRIPVEAERAVRQRVRELVLAPSG
jgi:DeoR/GlpR family transcriptional regulator of sugar metabolism